MEPVIHAVTCGSLYKLLSLTVLEPIEIGRLIQSLGARCIDSIQLLRVRLQPPACGADW